MVGLRAVTISVAAIYLSLAPAPASAQDSLIDADPTLWLVRSLPVFGSFEYDVWTNLPIGHVTVRTDSVRASACGLSLRSSRTSQRESEVVDSVALSGLDARAVQTTQLRTASAPVAGHSFQITYKPAFWEVKVPVLAGAAPVTVRDALGGTAPRTLPVFAVTVLTEAQATQVARALALAIQRCAAAH
jgi:hypothetical protein